MTCHQDDERYLARSLSSCVLQSIEHQIILVFTGDRLSSDTRGAIDASDAFVHLLKTDPGHAACRNIAVQFASYDYYIFLDADDYFYPDAVTDLYNHIGDADVICGNMTCDNNIIVPPEIRNGATRELFMNTNPVFISSLFTIDAFYNAGGMDADVFLDDYRLWIKMFLNGAKFSYLDRTVFYHYIRPDSITQKHKDRNEEFIKKAKEGLL